MIHCKQMPGYPNYLITINGIVLTRRRKGSPGGKLSPTDDNHGYPMVRLYLSGKGKSHRICRLVLEAFAGPCPEGMECRHLNGNKCNNSLDNLCWGTPKENQADRIAHGTSNRGERNPQAKLTEANVKDIRQHHKGGLYSQKELAQMFNIDPSTVSYIITRKNWNHV